MAVLTSIVVRAKAETKGDRRIRVPAFAGMTNKRRMNRLALLSLALLATPSLAAKPAGLTVKSGETWEFALSRGQPAQARKVSATSEPGEGRIRVTVRSMMGTTMTIVSNNPRPYTYTAELIGGTTTVPARSCTLPADGRLSFENWPQKADAIRLSNFKPAKREGSCP